MLSVNDSDDAANKKRYTFVRELYKPTLLARLGDGDGWSLFAAGKALGDEKASDLNAAAVGTAVSGAATSTTRPRAHTFASGQGSAASAGLTGSPKTPRKWGKFGRRGASDMEGGFGTEIHDIRLATESKDLITEFTCITQYKL